MPGAPRDVVSNLAAWYGGDAGGAGGMMSGADTANAAVAKDLGGVARTPANLVAPMTSLMNAYRSGNVPQTKQALIGALNAGMSTEQLMKTFNLQMKDIDYLRGQGYYLPAMTNEIKDVIGQELKNPTTAYANIVKKMDATGTNPAAVAKAMNLPVTEVQNAYNQLNPTGLFATNNPNFGAVDAGFIYNVAENPADYQTAIQNIQQYRGADEAGQQSIVERTLAAELAARPGSSLSALQQMGTAYGVSPADVAAAYAKLGYA
jgi:DNA-binding transcriptional regulator YhcF (GntR family)